MGAGGRRADPRRRAPQRRRAGAGDTAERLGISASRPWAAARRSAGGACLRHGRRKMTRLDERCAAVARRPGGGFDGVEVSGATNLG
ncbi:uncharacterized protein M6B38_118650 [Iris pallida]|uniref:Uncharacterized protein n=1 Tax=Iris pallida TaxID=29817 RepID=A0AAX6HK79_IRIPA|nr:uncharacterized protein M6B38_118650 [Iris pallida]